MSLRILVAGDAFGTVETAKAILAPLECIVIPAQTLSLALFLAHKNFPHLILCGLTFIDGSGFDFIKEIKADSDLSAIPFIFITTDSPSHPQTAQALALGAVDITSFPNNTNLLLTLIKEHLQDHSQEREPDTPE